MLNFNVYNVAQSVISVHIGQSDGCHKMSNIMAVTHVQSDVHHTTNSYIWRTHEMQALPVSVMWTICQMGKRKWQKDDTLINPCAI